MAFFTEKPTVRGTLGQSWRIISAGKLFYALFMHWYVFAQLSGNILNLKGTFSRKMSTKTRFFHNVSHQDWVKLDQSRQFIGSQPFQCLNMNMMNGCARLRFEFILYNHHHTTAFESRVVTIYAPGPYVSHQDRVFLDWFRNFTASQPFQSPIISIINGQRRLGLGCGL